MGAYFTGIPGPSILRLIGNWRQISPTHTQIQQWTYKYGNVFRIYIGSAAKVVISGSKAIEEVYSSLL